MTASPVLFTVGYEGLVQPQLIERLQAAGVRRVIDVRAVPQSRKPGFSRRVLAESLEQSGIAYTHLRALGTPKAGRIAARAGRAAEMEAVFAEHMRGEAPLAALAEVVKRAAAEPCCLLCFEREVRCCHRRVVGAMSGLSVVDL